MSDTDAALWAARKQKARDFLKDKPKPGHAWAEKKYEYDKEGKDNA